MVCFINFAIFMNFFYVNNRLWCEICGENCYKSIVMFTLCFSN